MENSLTERLTKLVQGLTLDEVVKASLLEAIGKNQIDQKLLEKVKFFIDQAIVDYEAEADKQIEKIRSDLNTTLDGINKEFTEIEKDSKVEQKAAAKRQDEQQLEEIRKKLSEQN